jgi:hypothetical protein
MSSLNFFFSISKKGFLKSSLNFKVEFIFCLILKWYNVLFVHIHIPTQCYKKFKVQEILSSVIMGEFVFFQPPTASNLEFSEGIIDFFFF